MEDSTEPVAEVITLHPPRTCFNCTDLDQREMDDEDPASGVASYCTLIQEWIDSEVYAASDCPAYDPVRGSRAHGGPSRAVGEA